MYEINYNENINNSCRVMGKDFMVSNDSRETGLNNNDLIIGQTGSGKTGSYVIPNLQVLDHSLIVADTKRNLYYKFKEDLEARGFEVKMLDFLEPLKSADSYNPLQYIRINSDGSFREQDIITIANSLVPMMDQHEPFWEQAARSLLACIIGYVLEFRETDEHNLVGVVRAFQRFCAPEKRKEFDMALIRRPQSFYARKYAQMMNSQRAEKMWASINEFVSQAINPYDAADYHKFLCEGECVDFAQLGARKTVLFLNVSDCDRAFDPIVNLLYTQAFQTLIKQADDSPDSRLDVPVRFILDDFATNTVISDFDKLISVIRSREIYVSIILQCKSQLESIYTPAEAKTIINNCDHTLYLGGHDYDTAAFVAVNAGDSIENVLMMPRDRAYLIETGSRARVIDKIKPYSTVWTLGLPSDGEPEA